jgi:hypothetical protein
MLWPGPPPPRPHACGTLNRLRSPPYARNKMIRMRQLIPGWSGSVWKTAAVLGLVLTAVVEVADLFTVRRFSLLGTRLDLAPVLKAAGVVVVLVALLQGLRTELLQPRQSRRRRLDLLRAYLKALRGSFEGHPYLAFRDRAHRSRPSTSGGRVSFSDNPWSKTLQAAGRHAPKSRHSCLIRRLSTRHSTTTVTCW